jgi:predicted RNA-binding Zn ribbon-like protein
MAETAKGISTDEATVLAFVNTHVDGTGSVERFPAGAEMAAWLEEVDWLGAGDDGSPVTDADAAEARELRDALLTILLSHARDPLQSEEGVRDAEERLRRAGARYPVVVEIDREGSRLRAAGTGTAGAFGNVLAAMNQLAAGGEWPRVKACRAETCRRGFIDASRNRSASFCSGKCSGRVSMQKHRARTKREAAD